MTKTTYPTIFANSHRGCFIDIKTDSNGKITWEKQLDLTEGQVPMNLLIWDGNIVCVTLSDFRVFDKDGKMSWKQTLNYASFAVVGNKAIYYQNDDYGLNAVNIKNKFILDDSYFPGSFNKEFPVSLFVPDLSNYLSFVQFAPNNNEEKPFLQVIHADYEDRLPKWVIRNDGAQSLPPLYIPAINHIILCLEDVHVYDGISGDEINTFELPLISSNINWSSDDQGNMFIIGSDTKSNNLLLVVDKNGKKIWSWTHSDRKVNWSVKQPPITSNNHNIYVFDQDYIYAINEGELVWEFKSDEDSPGFGTSLADSSLLVTAGNKLIHLGSDGKVRIKVELKDTILTPPVVDFEGFIYVATQKELVKIK